VSTGKGRVAVIGNGVVSRRVAHQVVSVSNRPLVELDTRRVDLASSPFLDDVVVAVLAHPSPHHPDSITLLDRGISVISVGDQMADVEAMMWESERATRSGASLVVGAGMSPGLVGLIARHLTTQLATADEIHVAIHGTAGPACARQHHRALAGDAVAFDDGAFVTLRAGTGRELAWFPEPVGAYDCYHAQVPGPVVLHRAFPDAVRISSRMSANRRDRLTTRLPMLTPPHREGGVGALRIEVRGADATGARVSLIAGVAEMVGTATAATACGYLDAIIAGDLPVGLVLPGEQRVDTTAVLRAIERRGVRLQEFTGVPST
jgi:hypothetical protein